MIDSDRNTVERILSFLDDEKYLFPQFGLVKINNDLCLLGGGGFSSVYEMYNRERPELRFALKIIGLERHTVSSAEFWTAERLQNILSQESRYIVRVLDAKELLLQFDNNGNVTIVKDAERELWEEEEDSLRLQFLLMEKLDKILERDRFKKVVLLREELTGEAEVTRLALEIGQALNMAHCYKVLHRDIKIENIFWDEQKQVYKLGDFGMAKYAEDGNAETIIYTDGYGAPEIERRLYDHYNVTADIYSFGITLYLLLNELRFPGSDGYYPKVEIQYNPEFVFPAPMHASAGMTRLIRKMCSFRAEDRYQCMADILSDLLEVSESESIPISENLIEMVERSTETYQDDSESKEDGNEESERPKTRAERKEEQRIANRQYRLDSVKYFFALTVLLVLLFMGTQSDISMISEWMFWLLPVAVLFEAVLQKVKEFHLFFGAVVVGFVGLSIYTYGITVPHATMLLMLLTGCSLLTAASSVAAGIWIAVSVTFEWTFLADHNLGWIALGAVLFVVGRYFNRMIR